MFTYKVSKPKQTSKKRTHESDSEDDLSKQLPKKSNYDPEEIIKKLSQIRISSAPTLKHSVSYDTLCSESDQKAHLDTLFSPGNSEYEQSDTEKDQVSTILFKPKPAFNLIPQTLLTKTHKQRIQHRYKSAIPLQVTESGQLNRGSLLNSNLNSSWKATSFLVTGYRFNSTKKQWVKKGPLSIHLERTINGNAKMCAHYLYGMLSTAFNFKCNKS